MKSIFDPEAIEKFHREQQAKRKSDPYSYSSLKRWFDLDQWTYREALCLMCDIDPENADIDWYAQQRSASPDIEKPRIENAQILSESRNFIKLPRHQTAVEPDDPDYSERVNQKNNKLAVATIKLQKIYATYDRALDAPASPLGHATPASFVEWALKRKIDIPWLDWAKSQGLVTTERSKVSGGKTRKETDSQKIDQISELREAAVQIAIKRRVNDGMPKKNITVKKISVWLLESGKFSTGEPFSTRWREAEGIRGLLKSKHNPLSDKRYLDAKPIKSPKFNP